MDGIAVSTAGFLWIGLYIYCFMAEFNSPAMRVVKFLVIFLTCAPMLLLFLYMLGGGKM